MMRICNVCHTSGQSFTDKQGQYVAFSHAYETCARVTRRHSMQRI
jgi:hypothetical protein